MEILNTLLSIDFNYYLIGGIVIFYSLEHILHNQFSYTTTMDASTNFRGHPIETMFWFGTSNIIAAAIFGLDTLSLGLYFLVATPFFFLEHANLRFPAWLDKTVGLVFTTPNLHKIHHKQDQHYTDSNFADIFILWDRIFGTYTYKPVNEIKFGLKEFDDDRKQTFWYLFKSPFINIHRTTSEELLTKQNNDVTGQAPVQ